MVFLTMLSPPVCHEFAGAHYIGDVHGVKDEAVIAAVRWHTTGRADMSLLEKVVYIADLTSEDRTFPDIERVRALSEESLDAAVRYAQCYVMEKLVRQRKPVVQEAWEAYNYYLPCGVEKEPVDDVL